MIHKHTGLKRNAAIIFLAVVLACCLFAGGFLLARPGKVQAEGSGTVMLTDGSAATATLTNKPITSDAQKIVNADPITGIVDGGLNRAFGSVEFIKSGSAPALAKDALAGSNDGKVIDLKTHYYDQGIMKITFAEPVVASEAKILTFRMYFDIDRNPATVTIGYYNFYADRTDMDGQYFYRFGEMVSRQRQWVDIQLTGQDVMNLADEEGMIGALYFVATLHWEEMHTTGLDSPPDGQYGHIYIDEITYENAPDQGGYPYLTTMDSVTAVLDDYPKENDPDLKAQDGIKGVTSMVSGGLSYVGRAAMTENLPAGSEDGKGVSLGIVGASQNGHQGLAHFEFRQLKGGEITSSSVKASEIAGLSVRVWFDVEEDVTSDSYVRGNYYLMSDRYNIENYYYYPMKVRCNQQKQWLDLIITGEDLMKLADEEGNISGLYFYYDTYYTTHPTGGTIYIDSIRYDSYEVTYMDGSETVSSQTVVYGDTVSSYEMQAPSGKVFAGWTTDAAHPYENLYQFNSRVTGDVTLHTWWLNQTDSTIAAGLYVSEAGDEISVYEDGTLYIKDALPFGTKFLRGTDGTTDYAVYELNGSVGCFTFTQGNLVMNGTSYTYTDSFTVTYTHYKGNEEIRYALDGEYAEDIAAAERAGFSFIGWSLDGEEVFDFDSQPVTGNMRLTALWEYVEAKNVSTVYGTYYFAGNDTKIVLKEGGVAQIIAGGTTSEVEYHYLVSEQLVFVGEEEMIMDYDTLQCSFVYDGNNYSLLGKYFVMFYSDNILIARAQASEGDYLITAPQTPVKEGYTFKGWQTSDGTAFDPTATVTKSVSAYAVWEKISAGGTQGEVVDGSDTAVWVTLGVTLAVVVAFGCAMFFIVLKKTKAPADRN